ncbi:hypothetical protein COO60DRAFT_767052 [Scenedesmus sp. NREL 46B-D3]|nr:hypothetical protein COO60DRAFT_767052 [Scenedesmus sp. NREL 46B-D3]
MLSLLLSNQQQTAQQQQQQGAPPLEQHRHAQRARRSDAWEEWAGWELEQEQRQQQQAQHASAAAAAAAGDSTSSGAHSEGWLMGFLQGVASASGYYQQQRQRLLGSSSSGQAGPAAAAGAETAPAPQVALVFCYANDLSHYLDNNWTSFGLQPDYRPAVVVASPGTTAAATQQPNTGGVHVSSATASRSTASASGAATANASPTSGSPSALPVTDLQLPVPLHHPQEGQWASAWLQLPAACVQQRGLLEQQLQAESEETEHARWSDLPEAVKRRGAAWWK